MKKWNKENIEEFIRLNASGLTNKEIAKAMGRTAKAIIIQGQKLGLIPNKKQCHVIVTCECCGKNFDSLINENRKYCGQSCAAKINDKKYPKRKRVKIKNNKKIFKPTESKEDSKCIFCGKILTNQRRTFCSNTCFRSFKKNEKYSKIESGDTTLNHRQYRKYLIEKYGEKCMKCGWQERNPITGNVPIQLEHIDGNSENNSLSNLELLCPNCHSLTPTYMALNMGNGRYKRRQRYAAGKS